MSKAPEFPGFPGFPSHEEFIQTLLHMVRQLAESEHRSLKERLQGPATHPKLYQPMDKNLESFGFPGCADPYDAFDKLQALESAIFIASAENGSGAPSLDIDRLTLLLGSLSAAARDIRIKDATPK